MCAPDLRSCGGLISVGLDPGLILLDCLLLVRIPDQRARSFKQM